MSEVPSNLIPTRITQLPYAPVASEESLLLIVYQGNTYQIMAGDLLQVAGVPTSRQVIAGTGLTGGGQLTNNVTLSIANGGVGTTQLSSTGVTAGQYGSATEIPVFSVDAKGRITAATTIPATVSGYVPVSREVIAGEGLNGGGPLNANVTLNVDLASATPLPGDQAGSAGSSTDVARADHVHPAVDLSDADEVDGILGLSNGGTAKSLVANAGAIIWSGADGLYVGPAGVAGQILQSNGTSQYVWVDQSGLDVGQADNLNGGAANRIAVQTAPDTTGFVSAPTVTDTFLKWNGSSIVWDALAGAGTVTSVNASGGTTGMTFSGGPITASGTLTLSGTLIPANGGTGISSYAVGDLLFANTTSTLDKLTVGSNGFLLASNGTAPQYTNPASVTVGAATTAVTATNLAGGAGGSIPYQSSAGTTTFLASGTGVLTASGGNPSYTMSPSLTQVTVAADPTTNLQVATKQYVDTIATTSVHYHTPVKYEVPNTTGNLNATYNNGASGVGATLTNAGTLGAFTPDGIVASVNDRILIYNQTNAYENGVYTVTTVGNGSTPWVLTRATDANTYDPISPNALGGGDAFFVTSGNTGAGETYVCNNVGTITFGTTPISFVQVSATQVYSAGTGLTLTGTTFSLTAPVATSLGGTGLTSFTSGGAVYATSTSALTTGTLPVTAGGTGKTTLSAGYLLNGNGTSDVSASIIYDDGANVGIGCTGSLSKLTLPNGSIFSFQDSGGISRNVMQFLSTGELRYGGAGAGIVSDTFYTGGSERMRITSTGRVGIGTTSPGATFVVSDAGAGGLEFNPNSSSVAQLEAYNRSTSAYYAFRLNADDIRFCTGSAATERMRIDSSGQVGIGAAAGTGTTLRIGKNLTGAVNVIGVYNNQAIQSDVTNNASLFATFPTTAASAFTLSSLYHFNAAQSTIGATSAITTQIGFLAQSSLTGATNNYGFYGALASGTGRYNLYMAGTADNYLAGNLGIGTTAPAVKLDVVNGDIRAYNGVLSSYGVAGTATLNLYQNSGNWRISNPGGYLQFYDITAAAERMRIDSSGNLGINATPQAWGANFKGIEGYGNSTFFLSGNSVNGITTVGNSYQNGTNWVYTTTGAAARYQVGITTAPHIWSYAASGTAGATVTWSEAMRIDSSGNVGIGTASPSTKLDVSGTVKATAFTGIDGGTF